MSEPASAPPRPSPESAPAPEPEIVWSGPPSRRAVRFAWLLRVILRPLIALSAIVSGLGIRFGPRGIEMWAVWAWLHRVGDRLAMIGPRVPGTTVERVALAHCEADYVRADGVARRGRAILYLHGGGFVAGGLGTYRRFVSRLSRAADATVLNVGYRLLPRSPVRHAIDDGVDGYRRLLGDGFAPEQIVIGGDSAGGGLAFLVAEAIARRGLPRPAGVVGLSPWADLDPGEKLGHPAALTDPVIPIRSAKFVVEKLIQKDGPELDRELSPVNLDLSRVPPALIHVGTTEVLALDATKLARHLARDGVPVTLKCWVGQVHVFQVLGLDVVPEAREALREIGAFVRDRTAAA
jgi:acetyl esterase/lipase